MRITFTCGVAWRAGKGVDGGEGGGGGRAAGHCLDLTTQPNEPDYLLKEMKFSRFSEKTPD